MAEVTPNTYVIAEIANAHQGDPGLLLQLIEAAAASGAQAVKVQWFRFDSLAMPDYEWYDAYLKLFIEPAAWRAAFDKAAALGLDVWADIFDDWGVAFAGEMRGRLAGVKLPPTVLEDDRLGEAILALGLPTLVGIGGWTEEQIAERYRFLRRKTRNEIILMPGFQGYPTSVVDCNLSRIRNYVARYKCRVGIADHVDGGSRDAIDVPAYAVCCGASVIEKHLTLDRAAKGYDYYSSVEPPDFARMVAAVRNTEVILGGMARSENETKYLAAVPRAVLRTDRPAGSVLTPADVVFRRTSAQDALTPAELKARLPAVVTRSLTAGATVAATDLRKPRVAIAVICRLKSTRLKRKALAEIAGVASALRCLLRCRQTTLADEVFLATSDLPEDDDLVSLASQAGTRLLRGDPESVLQRLLQVAEAADADVVVRVTGDCPVIAPEVLDFLIAHHLRQDAEYTVLGGDYPVGLAGDVFSVAALRRLRDSDADLSLTEYLRYYFEWNKRTFHCEMPRAPARWRGRQRLTLDVQEDLDMFARLYEALAARGKGDGTAEIMAVLDSQRDIAAVNAHIALVYKSNEELIARIRAAVNIRNIQPRLAGREQP